LRAPDRLRVALFTYSTQPRGGVLHALALAEALFDAGHDVMLHALSENGRGFIREPRCPFELIASDPPRGDTARYVRASIDTYVAALTGRTQGYDVYHAHDGISGNALATLVERGALPHFVRTVHHLDDFGPGELASLQRRSVERAAALLVVSARWRDHLAAVYGRASAVVPNGVDLARFVPPLAVAADGSALPAGDGGDAPTFVTIGGIEARKNTLATLEAFALVRARRPRARLTIAGGASVLDHSAYRRAFDARADELGLRDNGALEIAGVVSDAAIVALLQRADALVFPSLLEGFGLVVLEALACGLPVVTSAIAPFTEFLTAREALLVDPLDPAAIAAAMLRACDPAVAVPLRAAGRELVASFTWRDSAVAHVRAYRDFSPAMPQPTAEPTHA
jgi:glycosyltransferase-like protein